MTSGVRLLLFVLAAFVAGAGFVLGLFCQADPPLCRDQVAAVRALPAGFLGCPHPDHWLSLVEVQSAGLLFCECRERR